MNTTMRKLQIIPLAALLLAGCQDLNVTNPNRPDRSRATQDPISTESFVASSFRTWWPIAGHGQYPSWALSTIANDVTSGFADFGQLELSAEPRQAWNNSPVNARRGVNDNPWFGLYRTISAVNDALASLDEGLIIVDASRTARARTMGKFIQGISYGYMGMYFDKAVLVDEAMELEVFEPTFSPYTEIVDAAIGQLDDAIIAAQTANFTLPDNTWLFTTLTRDEVIRLANSFAARIMVYSARTPAERAGVDWTEVIARIDAGITSDFAPVAQPDIFEDDWKRLLARVRQLARPSDFGRPNNWLLGPADSTDRFVNWVATPVADRMAFQIVTADRRIQGNAGPASPGKYVGFNQNNIFAASRGTYRYSWYYFHRYGTGTSWQAGPTPDMLVSEMDLLKAEGLIRLNRADEAVPLINKTRVANGELPPVDINGPPDVAGCVPRKFNGACGSLWDALRHEKRLEGLGVSGVIGYFDARGWGALPEHSIMQLPVPGRELATLELPNYTFGGPGGDSSAPAPNPEACPVTLPRC
jgi:hypothetical protein